MVVIVFLIYTKRLFRLLAESEIMFKKCLDLESNSDEQTDRLYMCDIVSKKRNIFTYFTYNTLLLIVYIDIVSAFY